MQIAITGSGGFIGSALVPLLTSEGHVVTRLIRSPDPLAKGRAWWNPEAGTLDAAALEGLDALVHLAGEPLVGRWTTAKKTRIRESRVRGTRGLCSALPKLSKPPRVLVTASASGYYGNAGDEVVTEETPAGSGFLAQLCTEWEAATEPAVKLGIRVVRLRIGIVLSPAGGALKLMLPPFRLGLGGRLGTGGQFMSWVAMADLLGAIRHVLTHEALTGACNVVAPHPVRNTEFTQTLGRVLNRPTGCPVPAVALRFLFGELADEVLLSSTRVAPQRLQESGYAFRYPELESALRYLLAT